MNKNVIKEDFKIKIDKQTVLDLIHLEKDSHIYEDISEEYKVLEEMVLNRIKPRAAISFSVMQGDTDDELLKVLPVNSPVLYSMITLGKEISLLYQSYFEAGEYIKGLLVDAMADACLFAMEAELKDFIKKECETRNLGVSCRYDAPVNIPMSVQKIAFDEINAEENLKLYITEGFMLDPVKSLCQVFALTEDKVFKLDHDCSICDALHCRLRQIPEVKVIVKTPKGERMITCQRDESLLKAMIRNELFFPAVCGGNGLCGKCNVQILEGDLSVTKADEKYFTSREIKKGNRLACMAYPEQDCKIAVYIEEDSDFEVLSDFRDRSSMDQVEQGEDYAFAVDIGTTTIAISLVERQNNNLIDTYTAVNHQRLYGADVISRIKASIEGKKEYLRQSIQKDLLDGFHELMKRQKIQGSWISEIVIAGNTTMGHLLLGFDLSGLGAYPFQPVDISLIQKNFHEVFMDHTLNCTVTILPGISAFVGGDIVAGLYFNDFFKQEKINLLLDLGTNGEMVLGNKDRLLTTSTAAGPAFEGGNITWGMGSISGAMTNVTLQENGVSYETIGGKAPKGICGTGVIAIMSELLRTGSADATGLLQEEYRREGYVITKSPSGTNITFTQKDIRELQLAKAAIRAGIEVLLLRYGISYDQVNTVYLAGGFGFKINQEKAIQIGLLPDEFRGRIEVVGNSSLGGGVKYLKDRQADDTFNKLIRVSEEINLPMEHNFHELYVEYMNF